MKTEQVNSSCRTFYTNALHILRKQHIEFMVGGTYAITAYTGIKRPTKDLDIYCKAGDYPHILEIMQKNSYTVELTYTRWLGKVKCGNNYIDVLFGTASEICRVDDLWIEHAPTIKFLGLQIKLVPIEELIWVKSFMQDRRRSEGPDVNHLILKKGKEIDWKRLLMRMDPYWELLLSHIMQFRFVYPSERSCVPGWVIENLLGRLHDELKLPAPKERICRGSLLCNITSEIS